MVIRSEYCPAELSINLHFTAISLRGLSLFIGMGGYDFGGEVMTFFSSNRGGHDFFCHQIGGS